MSNKVQIEKTSKELKLKEAIGNVILFMSIVGLALGMTLMYEGDTYLGAILTVPSGIVFVTGFAFLTYVHFRTWWEHG